MPYPHGSMPGQRTTLAPVDAGTNLPGIRNTHQAQYVNLCSICRQATGTRQLVACPPSARAPGGQAGWAYFVSGQTGSTLWPKVAAMMSPAAWYQARTAKARVTQPPALVRLD